MTLNPFQEKIIHQLICQAQFLTFQPIEKSIFIDS